MSSPSLTYPDIASSDRLDGRNPGYKLSRSDLMELALPFAPSALERRTLTAMAVVFVAYLGTAQAVHYLFPVSIAPALIWPPAGIALAGMALEGYAIWPAIALASLINSLLNGGNSIALTLVIAAANVLQVFLGAWLLRRFRYSTRLNRLHDAFSLMFVAVATTIVAPLARVVMLSITNAIIPTGSASGALGDWWTGEILSVLILTPFLMLWIAHPRVSWTTRKWVEAGAALIAVAAVDYILFWDHFSQARGIPLVYLLLLPLIWIALTLGPRIMTLALLLNATLAILGTATGHSATTAVLSLGDRLFQSEIFAIMISIIFLVLCAIAEERKENADQLKGHVDRLEEAVAQIQKQDEAKGRFIATLAHELRNPLAPLLSSLELLNADPTKSDDTRMAANDMTLHVRTMRHLLDDLLDISRISRGKLTLQKEHTELHSVVAQSVRTVDDLMTERNHTLNVDVPDRAILLEADPVRLEQIMVNLLNNAAKYTEPGGTITLSVQDSGGMARISVKDNGIGIDPALQHRIFEPFLQLEGEAQKISGLGIGLSLTKNLVDMHDGTINVRSEGAGKGTEFVVELPYAAPSAAAVQQETTSGRQGFRILIVDDNRAAADALGKLLRHAGHTVYVVYSGTEALEAAQSIQPDIVLLDIGMPDMDGHETARRLRSNGFTAVLIALTGYGQDSDRRKAQESGFNHHLTKPVGLAELEEVFAEIPMIV